MKHPFTDTILELLRNRYGDIAEDLLDKSPLLQYINVKTRLANRGSKARGAFANHYALYVLVEDYIAKGYLGANLGKYQMYEGARFTDLFQRQRELPFGNRLQNHALNSRVNDEFAKYFPAIEMRPILRDQTKQRYWVNEGLLIVQVGVAQERREVNIAQGVIEIIDNYVNAKRAAFKLFIESCEKILALSSEDSEGAVAFVENQLQPNVDARIFEIVSFAILKAYYGEQSIFWGWSIDEIHQDFLMLYKTGRTNANDGGIDFVMKPLGRFFQVTETREVTKYFLDIDKVHQFPLTFVVKSNDPQEEIMTQIRQEALRKYGVDAIVTRYMDAIEEVINIPRLLEIFTAYIRTDKLQHIIGEIVLQSRMEFNLDDEKEEVSGG